MNCPNCGKEMDYGFMQCDTKKSIHWVSKLLPMGIGCYTKDAQVIFDPNMYGLKSVPAYICKDCELFVGDYSNNLKK